ncbi:arylesterase [Thiohalobacter thiocyanaticus]|uniref:Arylesterase n=1 Tax=Thiohalobacter thiocyanaticus TaxID=585455 RepID=A0A426QH45_9GAMM|nr:arylesterase [Thiohalobacter thiocyanaticus]RRQ21079.1 arylesterase [Thiohalobacter thiocyanaticus]
MRLLKLLVCLLLVAAGPVRAEEAPRILVLGDSISAAYGMELEQGWVHLLQQRLRDQGYPHRVVNASISGETTAGGAARLPALLQEHTPCLVVIELGGNDGLRGLGLQQSRDNLAGMTERAQAAGARVLLLGMRLPPNYGPAYTDAFADIYHELADSYETAVLPFLLEDVALEDGLMQADRIHPTAAAQPRLLDNVWPVLEPLLELRD